MKTYNPYLSEFALEFVFCVAFILVISLTVIFFYGLIKSLIKCQKNLSSIILMIIYKYQRYSMPNNLTEGEVINYNEKNNCLFQLSLILGAPLYIPICLQYLLHFHKKKKNVKLRYYLLE